MTFGNATLRGGQTLLHDARMWGPINPLGDSGTRPDYRHDPRRLGIHHDERP